MKRSDKNSPVTPFAPLTTLERSRGGEVPPAEGMRLPDQRLRLSMRDGVLLDTNVWLPTREVPCPAILLRTPYKDSVIGFKHLGVLRYVTAGYAVVIQQIRGVGASGGNFTFNSPKERSDGYDTIEWIAAQTWCTGAVGMDGSSYVGMTQLAAAAEQPPHLRCIVPAVPSVDFFREIPYCGGAFNRQHSINWTHLLQIESLSEQTGGILGTMPMLSRPEVLHRMTARPLRDAANGELEGDFLKHFLDVLDHPTFDDWWRDRSLSEADFARIDIPTLVVTGNFDLSIGPLTLWRALEAHAGSDEDRNLLIGPWDHAQCYGGGSSAYGPYALGEDAMLDLPGLRLAFFDRHLKGEGVGLMLGARVRLFITGANEWRHFDRFPPDEVQSQVLYLSSSGHANSARGDGRLQSAPPGADEPEDVFVDDPTLPFVSALSAAREPGVAFDLRERERHHETLVYETGELAVPWTLLGEGEAYLHVAADVPDADIALWLAEHRADGSTVRLATGQLRLRYRGGFDEERLLVTAETILVRIPLTYVGHQIPAGSRLRLLVSGSNFPWADPNPHTGEPVATAVTMRPALQKVFHDVARPSRLILPTLA